MSKHAVSQAQPTDRQLSLTSGTLESALLSKSALVARAIALDALSSGFDDHMPPIGYYARELNVGTGTVQTALRYLQRTGALDLEPRGRHGTHIQKRGFAQLWHIAVGRSLLAGMPMPYSRVFEGLATGLRECFRRESLSLAFMHIDGSRRRLETLIAGELDFAVISTLGANMMTDEGHSLTIVSRLGRGSFMHDHVVVRSSKWKRRRRATIVGVDGSSVEHPYISRVCCEAMPDVHAMEFRQVSALDFGRELIEERVDLIVWPSDETSGLRPPGLTEEPMPEKALRSLGGAHREAALVARSVDSATHALVTALMSKDVVRRVQAQVLRGLRTASY